MARKTRTVAPVELIVSEASRIVVHVDADTSEHRSQARKLAMKAAGTVAIGRLVSVEPVAGGRVALTWTPASTGGRMARPVADVAVPVARTAPEVQADAVASLVADVAKLARGLADVTDRLNALATATPVVAPVPAAPRAERKPTQRQAAAAAAACKGCNDHGVVKAVGKRAGAAYGSADGAAWGVEHKTAKVCAAKGCKSAKRLLRADAASA